MRYVISGPSGVGKTTIIRMLKDALPVKVPISATDRAPRPGEINGDSYYFKTQEEFQQLIEKKAFVEYIELEHRYGTLRSELENTSKDLILDVDVNGALRIRECFEDAILIFIAPPSIQELECRLRARNDGMPEAELRQRLIRANHEISFAEEYDFIITNHNIQQTFEEVMKVILASRDE